jgi:hypothetical protein
MPSMSEAFEQSLSGLSPEQQEEVIAGGIQLQDEIANLALKRWGLPSLQELYREKFIALFNASLDKAIVEQLAKDD